jgi:hypothetical protein
VKLATAPTEAEAQQLATTVQQGVTKIEKRTTSSDSSTYGFFVWARAPSRWPCRMEIIDWR